MKVQTSWMLYKTTLVCLYHSKHLVCEHCYSMLSIAPHLFVGITISGGLHTLFGENHRPILYSEFIQHRNETNSPLRPYDLHECEPMSRSGIKSDWSINQSCHPSSLWQSQTVRHKGKPSGGWQRRHRVTEKVYCLFRRQEKRWSLLLVFYLWIWTWCLELLRPYCYQSIDKAIQVKRPEPQKTREAEATRHVRGLGLDFLLWDDVFHHCSSQRESRFLLTAAGSILANVSLPFGYSHSRLLTWRTDLLEKNKLKSPYAGSSSKMWSHLTLYGILYKIRGLPKALSKAFGFKLGLPNWKWHASPENNFPLKLWEWDFRDTRFLIVVH